MTAIREPLSRWSPPRGSVLQGSIFPSGKPPFSPFPTVTNLLNSNHCTVAIYYDLIHGMGNALIRDYGPPKRRGELFHSFIAHLKLALKNRKLMLPQNNIEIQQEGIKRCFFKFAQEQRFTLAEYSELWENCIQFWVSRKLEKKELQSISPEDQYFFEISIANLCAPFPLGKEEIAYPLRGRVDEIDLIGKRIIERTIKNPVGSKPPKLKDYQVWLLWKLLCSLRKDQLPYQWRSVDFQKFDLWLETPNQDFPISKEDSQYLEDTHSSYAWISDISSSETSDSEVYENENPACTPINPDQNCEFIRTCFHRNWPHPQCGAEIKQIFKPRYRVLLWERMWEEDLFHYQLLKLKEKELIEKGLISKGEIVSFNEEEKEIQLKMGERIGSIRGYNEYIIIFGTLFCGKKMKARLMRVEEDKFILKIQGEGGVLSDSAFLLPSSFDISLPILQEPPAFLEKGIQRGLLKLQHWCIKKPESAEQRSLMQLLEAVFGIKPLRRGSR